MRSVHLLERNQRIELPIDQVFAFYGDARNLERITPPWLGFEVTTPAPIEMGVGTLIEYRLKLHRMPVRWRTRIEVWEPPGRFVDVQVRGPYSLWEHTHQFEEDGPGATVIRDRVRYSLPFGPLGELAERLLVRRDLKQIFDYRRDAVTREMSDEVSFAKLEPGEQQFQLLRRELGVTSFGINSIALRPRQRGRIHRHERQEEVYLVLEGELTLALKDEERTLGKGELARVAPQVRRQLVNRSAAPTVFLALGGAGEHQGRDGRAWSSWDEGGEGRPPQEVPQPEDLPAP